MTGLRIHVIVFVLTMMLLAGIDWYTAEPYWVHWVLLGWGAGLLAHAYFVLKGKHHAKTGMPMAQK